MDRHSVVNPDSNESVEVNYDADKSAQKWFTRQITTLLAVEEGMTVCLPLMHDQLAHLSLISPALTYCSGSCQYQSTDYSLFIE